MAKDTKKVYNQTTHKLRENFEDVRYLIALYNLYLTRLEQLNEKVDRMWQAVNGIYEDT